MSRLLRLLDAALPYFAAPPTAVDPAVLNRAVEFREAAVQELGKQPRFVDRAWSPQQRSQTER
jgi:hypothetical protein